MFNKELMSPEALEIYTKAQETLTALRKKHSELIKKAKDKTISEKENEELRLVIKAHGAVEKLRKEIWDDHSLAKLLQEKQ